MTILLLSNKIASINAQLLGIPAPSVCLAPGAEFLTPTTRAASEGENILINRDLSPSVLDLWLAISHEMRHIWQVKNGVFSAGYIPADGETVTAYNLQPDEIDAHAWSVYVMESFLRVRPTLEKNLGADAWKAIENRKFEIIKEINKSPFWGRRKK